MFEKCQQFLSLLSHSLHSKQPASIKRDHYHCRLSEAVFLSVSHPAETHC